MKISLQNRLYLGSAITMVTGLGLSALISLAAVDASDMVSVYDFDESKKSLHALELYGGKASVLAVEFMKWFSGLWHGKSLAYTTGCITILLSFALLYVAYHSPSTFASDGLDKNRQDRAE